MSRRSDDPASRVRVSFSERIAHVPGLVNGFAVPWWAQPTLLETPNFYPLLETETL